PAVAAGLGYLPAMPLQQCRPLSAHLQLLLEPMLRLVFGRLLPVALRSSRRRSSGQWQGRISGYE
ncbi:hypothetical protein V8G57_17760, partial [Collimonas sp. H4R21]